MQLRSVLKIGLVIFALCGSIASAEPKVLQASWYSVQSLIDEGTYKTSKGVMANGQRFHDSDMVCATRLFPLGARLRVTNIQNGRYVQVTVADRIGKRFEKTRIDLSSSAFKRLAPLREGIIKVSIKRIS